MTQFIRRAQIEDIPAVEGMQSEWRSEYRLYQRWDRRFLIDGIGPYFLVGEHDGELVGYILADDRRQNPKYRDVIIHDLFVKHGQRQHGIGKLLLHAIVNQARTDEAPTCKLTPSCEADDLDRLVAFYKGQGFVWDECDEFMARKP